MEKLKKNNDCADSGRFEGGYFTFSVGCMPEIGSFQCGYSENEGSNGTVTSWTHSHEPLYEFCAVVIAYCNEQMAMTRLLEGSIRGMNGAQKKLLRQIDDILEEDKENG